MDETRFQLTRGDAVAWLRALPDESIDLVVTDPQRPTGWNNTIFPNVGMPHVFWELQGEQTLDAATGKLSPAVGGQLSAADYDREVADLVVDGGRSNAQGVLQLLIKEVGERWKP